MDAVLCIICIYDDPQHSLRLIGSDGSVRNFDVEQIQTNDNQTFSGIAEAFVDALFSRDGGDLAAEKVLSAMKAVFAAIRSNEEGRFVAIDYSCTK